MARKKTKKKAKRRPAKKRVAKKRVVKRAAKRAVKKRIQRKPAVKKPKENIIGIVTHYFPQVKAAAIKLKAPLNMWDSIRIKGHTTDFTQTVNSLQIDRQPITKAKRGQEIGLLVSSRVRRNDTVYKV